MGREASGGYSPRRGALGRAGIREGRLTVVRGPGQLRARKGVYGQEGAQQTLLCAAFTDAGLALTGAQVPPCPTRVRGPPPPGRPARFRPRRGNGLLMAAMGVAGTRSDAA